MHYHWNWMIFWEEAPDGGGTYLDTLISGLWYTLATAWLAWIIALAMGILIGTLRTVPNKVVINIGNAYVELFRNIPLLVQMFLWYFVMPELLPEKIGEWVKSLPDASFITGVISLGFYASARVAVQVSAGIQALPRGHSLAAKSLGLSPFQTYRYILLPLAFRIIMPSLGNEITAIIKNSSVALTIGLLELTARTRSMAEFSFQTFEAFSAATIIYFIVSMIAIAISHLVEKKIALPGVISAVTAHARGH